LFIEAVIKKGSVMSESGQEHKRATTLEAMRAVFWSFLGIRSKEEAQADITRLSIKQIIVFGIIGAAIFVTSVVMLVYFVTH
jgi:uncharacterized membrane protein (DUF4010 family)